MLSFSILEALCDLSLRLSCNSLSNKCYVMLSANVNLLILKNDKSRNIPKLFSSHKPDKKYY
jgi:hypothetical protein